MRKILKLSQLVEAQISSIQPDSLLVSRRAIPPWTDPFNGVKSYVSYEKTRFIVFCSRNLERLFRIWII